MELTLANSASNLLVLLLESLCSDIESFLKSVHYFLQTIPYIFLWWEVQTLNSSCDEQSHQESCSKSETLEGERRIGFEEINLIMKRLGMVGELENCGHRNCSFGEEDFSSLFDEEEPSLQEIMETFEVFDVNKDGFIDASELQRVICDLRLKKDCDLEDCKNMIKAFDDNGDELIDFQEFVKLMERGLC